MHKPLLISFLSRSIHKQERLVDKQLTHKDRMKRPVGLLLLCLSLAEAWVSDDTRAVFALRRTDESTLLEGAPAMLYHHDNDETPQAIVQPATQTTDTADPPQQRVESSETASLMENNAACDPTSILAGCCFAQIC